MSRGAKLALYSMSLLSGAVGLVLALAPLLLWFGVQDAGMRARILGGPGNMRELGSAPAFLATTILFEFAAAAFVLAGLAIWLVVRDIWRQGAA